MQSRDFTPSCGHSRQTDKGHETTKKEGAVDDLHNECEILELQNRDGGTNWEQQALQHCQEEGDDCGLQVGVSFTLFCNDIQKINLDLHAPAPIQVNALSPKLVETVPKMQSRCESLPSARGFPFFRSRIRPFQGAQSTAHSCVMAKAFVYSLTVTKKKIDY